MEQLKERIPQSRRRRPEGRTPRRVGLDLRSLAIGEPVAENERQRLDEYFWETSTYYRAMNTVLERPVSVDLLIEPGETEQLTQDFVIKSEIEATITSAYVVNGSVPIRTCGWYRRALHKHPKELT